MKLSVAALIATYRRPRELARLLDSLAGIESGLELVVVVDNSGSAEVQAVVEAARGPVRYVNAGENLGCGGGLRLAEERAARWTQGNLSHLLILDDDAVLRPDTVTRLAAAMEDAGAGIACPLVIDARGLVGWTPGVVMDRREIGRVAGLTPEKFRSRFGASPRDIIWAQGICLLVARELVEKYGGHRDDFWVRGEDLEFSLRMSARRRGLFVPEVVVEHLPPTGASATSRDAEYWRHCALLQNMAYLGFRLPHGRRIAWTIAGALRHFFRLWSWSGVADATRALWRGAVLGQPAGHGSGPTFRARCMAVESAAGAGVAGALS